MIDPKLATIALNAARRIIADNLEVLVDSYTLGGTAGRKAGAGLSIEGKHYAKPYRAALKKIDAALNSTNRRK